MYWFTILFNYLDFTFVKIWCISIVQTPQRWNFSPSGIQPIHNSEIVASSIAYFISMNIESSLHLNVNSVVFSAFKNWKELLKIFLFVFIIDTIWLALLPMWLLLTFHIFSHKNLRPTFSLVNMALSFNYDKSLFLD